MSANLVKYVTRTVPRYTSYPTAPHFSDTFTDSEYESWLTELDPEQPISLYLHVPFCRKLCWYCGCNMKLASREEPLAEYARTLRDEISLISSKLPSPMKLSHLHWGGGTPTALTPDDLERTMTRVREHFEFTENAELAIESDPRTLSDAMVMKIGKLGFTRASFGVQEFDPKVQKAINRIQPPDMVISAVENLRSAGVSAINFDLIYGLPYQTTETLISTIETCVAMQPNRIALFGYAHVPWMAKKQRLISEDALPGAMERLEQANAAADKLETLGYERIGLDHFALPDDPLALAARSGTLHRNFQGYTTDIAHTLLGVGATSIGRTPYGFVQNIAETGAWSRKVSAGELPVGKGLSFQGEDNVRGYIIEKIMCNTDVDLAKAARKFGFREDHFAEELNQLEPFVSEGLIVVKNRTIQLTKNALPVVRVIASIFDQYHQQQQARHSVAV